MAPLEAVFNGILIGASGYALYAIAPNARPYAFSACALGLCHGICGLIRAMHTEEAEEETSKCHSICTSVMEIVPLPLVNIELYMQTNQTNAIALGHGLFILPFALELFISFFSEEPDEENRDTLRHLTILGNVVSLLFLAVNESNYLYGGMALTAFLTKYGSMLMESFFEGTGENCVLCGYSVFNYLTSVALGGEKTE